MLGDIRQTRKDKYSLCDCASDGDRKQNGGRQRWREGDRELVLKGRRVSAGVADEGLGKEGGQAERQCERH